MALTSSIDFEDFFRYLRPQYEGRSVAGSTGFRNGLKSAAVQWRNRWRRWMGEREPRAMPPAGPKPAPGARLVSGRARMIVQSGLSTEVWEFLVSMGWREETFRPDRRRYEDVPRAWVLRLYQTPPHERQRILRGAIAAAKGRNPTPPALY